MAESPDEYRSPRERLTFSRSHHLKRKQFVEALFNRNDPTTHSVAVGTIRILYRQVDEPSLPVSFQVGVAVGKQTGSAVRRNRVKRVLRETIRTHQALIPSTESLLTAMVLYRGRFEQLHTAPDDVIACLKKLSAEMESR